MFVYMHATNPCIKMYDSSQKLVTRVIQGGRLVRGLLPFGFLLLRGVRRGKDTIPPCAYIYKHLLLKSIMPRTIYQSCVNALKDVRGTTITSDKLNSLILIFIGGQERTIKQALHTMACTGLIKDIGDCRFEIAN